MEPTRDEADVAIIGMAGRFPGADNVGELWQNLCDGVNAVRTLTDDELLAAGPADAAAPAAPREEELRGFLRERLPEYIVPPVLIVLDQLPLSANGKVDCGALPPAGGALPGARERIAPRTPEEQVLAGIWGQVLGVAQVGVDDHFFHLGGDSLLAVQLISRVRNALRVELPLRDFFDALTVEEMARRVVETGLTRKLARILITVQGMAAVDPGAGARE